MVALYLFTVRGPTSVASTVASTASTSAGVISAAGRSPSARITCPFVVALPRLTATSGSPSVERWLRSWERNSHLAPLRNLEMAPPRPTRHRLFEPHGARAEGGRQGWDHEWRRSSR